MAFINPFFSLAGQKERLTNVAATLKAAVTGSGVVSSTGLKPLDTVLSAAASHPFTTASLVAVAASPAATSALGKAVASTSTTTKVVAGAGALIAVPAVISNPQLGASAVAKTVSAPSALSNLGRDVGTWSKSPTLGGAVDVLQKNKGAAAVIAGVGIIAGGASVIGGINTIASTSATRANTAAVKATTVTPAVPQVVQQYLPSPQQAVIPLTPATVAATAPVATSAPVAAAVIAPKKKTTKKRKKKKTTKKKKKRKSKKTSKKTSKKKKYKKKKKKKR